MKILAFDTALGGCSVGVVDTETGAVTRDVRPMGRGQSEILVPVIQDVIAKSGIPFADLDLIATTVGPGAFTGLRIGLSTARSFGLALNIPVDGVLTTSVIAGQFFNENKDVQGNLFVLLETKRADFYAHIFSNENNALEDAVAISTQDLLARWGNQNLTICGDGAGRCRVDLGADWPSGWQIADGFDLTDPAMIATIAVASRQVGKILPPDPVYLRGADVSISTRPVRTIAGAKS